MSAYGMHPRPEFTKQVAWEECPGHYCSYCRYMWRIGLRPTAYGCTRCEPGEPSEQVWDSLKEYDAARYRGAPR